MKFKLATVILLTCAAGGFAQDRMADALRNGILEEDSKQNPGAAIQQYRAVLNQFADERQMAATALFRMAECYRKQGNRSQAVAAYQRVLKEFPDQTKLAAQSRNVMENIYKLAAVDASAGKEGNDRANYEKLIQTQNAEQARIEEARKRYRETIEGEIEIVADQMPANPKSEQDKDAVASLRLRLLYLQRELAAFDAGMPVPASR